MRKVLALVAVAALTAGVTGTSTAAVKKPKPKMLPAAKVLTITDIAGDANGINNQGQSLVPAIPEQSTPQGQRSAADILSVVFSRIDDKKTVQGIKVVMKLSAKPDQGTIYRVTASTPDCSTFFIQLSWTVAGTAQPGLRNNCGGGGTVGTSTVTAPLANVKVTDNAIEWNIALKELPSAVKIGTFLESISAHTRAIIGAADNALVTAPVFDQTVLAPDGYKIGQ